MPMGRIGRTPMSSQKRTHASDERRKDSPAARNPFWVPWLGCSLKSYRARCGILRAFSARHLIDSEARNQISIFIPSVFVLFFHSIETESKRVGLHTVTGGLPFARMRPDSAESVTPFLALVFLFWNFLPNALRSSIRWRDAWVIFSAIS